MHAGNPTQPPPVPQPALSRWRPAAARPAGRGPTAPSCCRPARQVALFISAAQDAHLRCCNSNAGCASKPARGAPTGSLPSPLGLVERVPLRPTRRTYQLPQPPGRTVVGQTLTRSRRFAGGTAAGACPAPAQPRRRQRRRGIFAGANAGRPGPHLQRQPQRPGCCRRAPRLRLDVARHQRRTAGTPWPGANPAALSGKIFEGTGTALCVLDLSDLHSHLQALGLSSQDDLSQWLVNPQAHNGLLKCLRVSEINRVTERLLGVTSAEQTWQLLIGHGPLRDGGIRQQLISCALSGQRQLEATKSRSTPPRAICATCGW